MSRTYVSIDLETTGLDPHHNEIIEVGAVKFQDGRTLAEFQSLVKPRQAMPAAITELTGITDEDLADAPNFALSPVTCCCSCTTASLWAKRLV